MRTTAFIGVVALLSAVMASGEDTLESWGDGTPDVDFVWRPDLREIVIVHGNGLNYKFWVHDGSGVPGTISIHDIDVDDNATGDFTIEIRHPDGRPGALHLEGADLSFPGGTSSVLAMNIASNFAFENRTVVLENVSGPVSAGYVIVGSLRILGTLSGTFRVAGDIVETGANTIEIGDIAPSGLLECENLVHGEIERTSAGQFVHIGPGDGLIEGTIRINGTLGETIHFRSACASTLEIGTIDSPEQPDPNMPYGGLYFTGGTMEECNVTVEDQFEQGLILAEKAAPALGYIEIASSLGSPGKVARIATGTTDAGAPIDFAWRLGTAGATGGLTASALGLRSLTRRGSDCTSATEGGAANMGGTTPRRGRRYGRWSSGSGGRRFTFG